MHQDPASHLKLVPTEPTLAQRRVIEDWLLGPAPDPLPDNEHLIVKLDAAPPVKPWQIRTVIDQLVSDGHLHVIHLGSQRHLTRLGNNDSESDEACFRLQIALDLELEKQLLLKTVLVLESISLFLICREVLLRWIGS